MRTILVVDDDQSLIQALTTRLRAASYNVITAGDGERAIELARAVKPDLLILDINLPKRVGYSVARMLKLDTRTQHIPILMLTARDQESDLRLGVLTGANAYMTKPFVGEELLAMVDSLLKNA